MTIRTGIVGFGARSSLWRHAHQPDRGSEVVAVCDTSERGRADARAEVPEDVLVTADLDELLALGLDAVLVLTPDHRHHGPALAALEAGTAVFCEKPLATTLEHCDELLHTARRTGSRLYVGHNMRHMPVVTQMRDLVRSGRIGAVKAVWCRHFVGNGGDYYFKDWHADRRNTTSLLLQKGAHDLDVIHWLAGGYTQRVQAMGALAVYGDVTDRRDRTGERMGDWLDVGNWPPASQTGLNPVVDVEDLSMMTMQLDNGVLASYQQCHFTPDYWRNYTVIGTEGRIENLGDGPGGHVAVWDRRHRGHAEPDERVPIEAAEGDHAGADPRLVAEFLRFAAGGGPTRTSPVAARMAVAAGVLATASLRGDGATLEVPPLPPDLVDYFERGQVGD
ncbi:Gfo/Idh/MocA family protein [Auraticoccus monumenti]|uniref:Predicted dehydrogenase n=1 Tax=Auraticoccus monumenti TaxID=675864 RepID=A0A1G7AIL9_9ACTN|nr:Gfo/Idh/MocA family oxidoreductase [Auraticoccus monumenti]SDE14327.1 Predicted dehydrogenase [Auraticoccus monumenti]